MARVYQKINEVVEAWNFVLFAEFPIEQHSSDGLTLLYLFYGYINLFFFFFFLSRIKLQSKKHRSL